MFAGSVLGLPAKLGLPMPVVWAYVVAAVEFGGGALLVLGLFTRLAALAAMIEFAVIVLAIKFPNGFIAFAPKAVQPGFPAIIPGGYELELLLGLMCLAFLLAGGRRLSLDYAIGREL